MSNVANNNENDAKICIFILIILLLLGFIGLWLIYIRIYRRESFFNGEIVTKNINNMISKTMVIARVSTHSTSISKKRNDILIDRDEQQNINDPKYTEESKHSKQLRCKKQWPNEIQQSVSNDQL